MISFADLLKFERINDEKFNSLKGSKKIRTKQEVIAVAQNLRKIGNMYRPVGLLTAAQQYLDGCEFEDHGLETSDIDLDLLEKIVKNHVSLNRVIERSGLREVLNINPMLNGKDI